MAIFKVIKDGVEEIIVQESSAFTYKPDGKTKSYAVHPATELSDVMWKRPERKVQKPDVITKKFTSKSNPDITYTSKKTMLPTGKVQYSCNCPGVWRAKSRECKHIKEMKKN